MQTFDQEQAFREAVAALPNLHVPPGTSADAHYLLRARGTVLLRYMTEVHFRSLGYMFDAAPRLRYSGQDWRDATSGGVSARNCPLILRERVKGALHGYG